MKSFIKPVAFNKVSRNVVLLKALDVLGLPVPENEAESKEAGPLKNQNLRLIMQQTVGSTEATR
jgi:hypothetical protein